MNIKNLSLLSNIFHVSLDDFVKEVIEEMRKIVDKEKGKEFNRLHFIFLAEMIMLVISAYPLVKFYDHFGILIWLLYL